MNTEQPTNQETAFNVVSAGEVFSSNGIFYIKIHHDITLRGALRLHDGFITESFQPMDWVTRYPTARLQL